MQQKVLVTFQAEYKIGKHIKRSTFTELHVSEDMARLRAMALNWMIVKVEKVESVA